MTHRRQHARFVGEQGIALIWSIIIMIIVIGMVTVAVGMTTVRTNETRDNANRTRSNMWVQAASDDLVQRLQSGEIGYDLATAPTTADDGRDLTLVVPTTGTTTPPTGFSRFNNPPPSGSVVAKRLEFTLNGTTHTGWYQVLPPVGSTTPWRALLRRDATRPDAQGSVEVLVRAWEHGRRAEPVTARLTYRKASFSRFSMLTDDKLTLGGLGTLALGGYIHTNNARNLASPIALGASVNFTNVQKITTTSGTISGPGCGTKCQANVRDVVDFGAAARAMDRVAQLDARTTPISYRSLGVARLHSGLPNNTTYMPVWVANLNGAGCADGVLVTTAQWALRKDTVGVPMIDDRSVPTFGAGGTCLPIAEGGGAILFDGDVIVTGNRTSRRPVTLLAQRRTKFNVRLDTTGDGVANNTARVTGPASIYVHANVAGTPVGSASSMAPVGLVAESGIYLPAYGMQRVNPTTGAVSVGTNNSLTVQNVAGMAMGAEIAYGPSIISVAAEAGQPGLGLLPQNARAIGHGYATQLRWYGSLASRRPVMFRYGSGAAFLGYGTRDLRYVDDLMWNSPPGFPSDRDWHLADYREFR